MDAQNRPQSGQVQRQIAFITNIVEINNGNYIKNEGWTPSYIISNKKKMSRVNLVGVIVSVNDSENFGSASFEDGSGSMDLIFFENKEQLKELIIGSPVTVIGRVREYNSKKSIIPEIIKPTTNQEWLEVRKLQIKLEKLDSPQQLFKAIESKELKSESETEQINSISKSKESQFKEELIEATKIPSSEPTENNYDKICKIIKSLDKENGADHQAVIEDSNMGAESAEKIITHLLSEGEIFEISPGKLKVLD